MAASHPLADIQCVRSYPQMALFNLLPIGIVAGTSLVLSGSSGQPASEQQRFAAHDETGHVIATVTMAQPLPAHDTSLNFKGPSESAQPASMVQPMVFEATGAFQCHWSSLIVICRTAEHTPAEARTTEGRYVRRLDAETVLVSDTPGGLAGDFTTYRDGRLIAFGVLDQSGATPWRYDAL